MKKLTFVTQNKNKLADMQRLLPDFEIEHINFDVAEIQSMNPKEIIEHKLKEAYDNTKSPCIVMDASLSINCLNGFPGPFIKWFNNTLGEDKVTQIVNIYNDKSCVWTNMVGYFDGTETIFIEESVAGEIADKPRGTNGYNWDVFFIPINERNKERKTFAEMTFEEKQSYAPTKKLMDKLKLII